MGIFGLWLLWRLDNRLEQIRRQQLTPLERAAEDRARAEGDRLMRNRRLFVMAVLVVWTLLACAFQHLSK